MEFKSAPFFVFVFWSERSACAALFLLSPWVTFLPEVVVTNKIRFKVKTNLRNPPPLSTPDMCADKFPPVLMGAQAKGQACADLGASNPIGPGGNFLICSYLCWIKVSKQWNPIEYFELTPNFIPLDKVFSLNFSSLNVQKRKCISKVRLISANINSSWAG